MKFEKYLFFLLRFNGESFPFLNFCWFVLVVVLEIKPQTLYMLSSAPLLNYTFFILGNLRKVVS